jgi:hypothetical protein
MTSFSTDARQIRRFGVLAFVIFTILCGFGIRGHKILPAAFFGCLAVAGMGFMLFPDRLRPLFELWMRTAQLINRGVVAVLLTLAYYLAITPTALLKRCYGGRPLPLKRDDNMVSYWVERPEPAQPKERFIKRY